MVEVNDCSQHCREIDYSIETYRENGIISFHIILYCFAGCQKFVKNLIVGLLFVVRGNQIW